MKFEKTKKDSKFLNQKENKFQTTNIISVEKTIGDKNIQQATNREKKINILKNKRNINQNIKNNKTNINLKSNHSNLGSTNFGINQNISKLKSTNDKSFDLSKSTLNKKIIKNLSVSEEVTDTSLLSLTNSASESISGTAENQKIVNQENVQDHIAINNAISNISLEINNISGKIRDEEAFEEINVIPEQTASINEKVLLYPITNNDFFFLKNSITNSTTHYIKNAGLNLVGENVNNIVYNTTNSTNSNYYGIYMSIVSDYDVTFTKFAQPSNQANNFAGINRISAYSFSSVKLNDRTTTTLSESYLNYDFLIIKSQVINSQQTIFNVVKTDKIVSDVALNYFGTLQYLTFVDETNFIMNDLSLLGIWGFKNNRKLKRIAIVNDTNFLFSETWTNYQFIFVSYSINGVLAGILIPTNSIVLNQANAFSIDTRSNLTLVDELNGVFTNSSIELSNLEIYGFNHIFEDWTSSIGTSKIPTVDSSLEGGNNQEQVNKNVHTDLTEVEEGTYNYSQLTLNGEVITKWPSESSEAASRSGEITDDSDVNPELGINPSLIQINKNTTDISSKANQVDLDETNAIVNQNTTDLNSIEEGTYNYPKLTLNNQEITDWSEVGGQSKTSIVTLVDPTLESISGTGINQEIANQENVNEHIIFNNTINNFTELINNISGKVVDEEALEEMSLISEQPASIAEKILPYRITDNNSIYFFKSSTNSTTDYFRNAGLNLIGENVNNIVYDTANSDNSNYYGIFMSIVSDYDITFAKFSRPTSQTNTFTGIKRISAYSFSSVQLNDRSNTTLSESYLNYDFLIIKSQVSSNLQKFLGLRATNDQQTTFNIIKTDKIISNVAMNYFGTLEYLTFTDETNFTMIGSSLLGIWGFKNNRQLKKIATLSSANFLFSESWRNYQFVFVSYKISGSLCGVLIATNSIVLGNTNVFSIDSRSSFKLTNELEGTYTSSDGKLSDVEIYGINHILKDGVSNINTSKIPTSDSELEGGDNQSEVNENVRSELNAIEDGTYDYPQLTLNGVVIDEWPTEEALTTTDSSKVIDDSDLNSTFGINPYLIKIDENTENIALKANQTDLDATNEIVNQNNTDLNDIENGTYNYPKLTLNGKEISEWSEGGQESNTSLINLVDSALESLSGNAINQETANKENVSDHIAIYNAFNTFTTQINSVIGKVSDEEEFEENNLVLQENADLIEKTLPYPITNNDFYFFKSSANTTTDFFVNAGLNLIDESVNNVIYDTTNSNNSNYYGFFMNVISDYDVTFTKFAQPTSQSNSFTGIKRISAYSFSNVQLNDRTSTTLSESYLNYDFLIIKSQVVNNQQTIFNVVKTDKIISNVALNYFGTLKYLTFTDETNFILNDSSLLGVWGFKNDRQLKRIAILSDVNFLFLERWTDYQFIFVSYNISGVLCGILIPTNSIVLNNKNQFSIDGRNQFTLTDELNGTFNNIDGKLSDVEIYGFNHIWKDGLSSINTLKVPTADSTLEGGENQEEVNINVQNSLTYLETNKVDKSDLDAINSVVTQNSTDLEAIENGTYDYPQLTLNGVVISEWPSEDGETNSSSSEITDDSTINPDKGINPYLNQIKANTETITSLSTDLDSINTEVDDLSTEVEGIMNGTVLVSSFTSALIDDSTKNPDDGINPYLNQIQTNINDIANLNSEVNNLDTEVSGMIDGTTPIVTTSNTSALIDDSSTNPDDGINPYLLQTQTNATDIANLNSEVNDLNTEVSGMIDGTTPIVTTSNSSEVIDDSFRNSTEGINPWKTQIDENTSNITLKADQSDLDAVEVIANKNNSDLTEIKNGDYSFPKLTLNGEEITEWPSTILSSSQIIDDSSINSDDGINPYLLQTQTNATNITNLSNEVNDLNTEVSGIIDGTTPIVQVSNTSALIDDSSTNSSEGINPYLLQTQTNTTDITNLSTELDNLNTEVDNLNTELSGIIDGTTPVVATSDSSEVIDDSSTNPTDGINPWKTQIDENTENLKTKANQTNLIAIAITVNKNAQDLAEIESGDFDFPKLTLNGQEITSWSSGSATSSQITDDSSTNSSEGINPYLLQTQTNATDIANLNTEVDNLNTEVSGIIDGTIPIAAISNTSALIDDSAINSSEGINPYLLQTQTNATDIANLNTEVSGIIDGTIPIVATSNTSALIDDSVTNSSEGINPYLLQTQTNATDIANLNTEVDNLNTEVSGIIDGTTEITVTTYTSTLIDDSVTNSSEGINPYLLQTQTNVTDIASLNTEVEDLNTQVTEIIDGTIPVTTTTKTSELIVDNATNSSDGINPYLIQTQTNGDDLIKIETGNYNFPQLILNGETIYEWPSLEQAQDTSLLKVVNPSLESISQNALNQSTVNIENVNDHIAIHNIINTFTEQINNAIGKVSDEDAFEEINLIPGQNASLSEKVLPNSITDNNIYFLKSSTNDSNVDFLKNSGFSLIGENVNNIIYDVENSNNSDYYGFYMNIVSDYDITFAKFNQPSTIENNFQGIKKISGYSFENTQLNDGNNTSLTESYLNYDFLIIKSQISDNQQTTFNIIKTDKIISNVALSYFGTLRYLTFTDKTNFITNDSSLLGIWGFKNNHQLNKIATLNNTDFVFLETWCNYQFIFISYNIDNNLAGILIPTNSLTLNNVNKFSIDGRSSFTITNELTGTFDNVDEKLSNVSIYGLNHIWKDGVSSLNTSKILTENSKLEGGNNQKEVNRNIQIKLRKLENSINSELNPIFLNNNNFNQSRLFGYSDVDSSPFIKNIDKKTGNVAELRVLTTGIDIIDGKGNALLPKSDANITPKIYVDSLLSEKVNKIDLRKLDSQINQIRRDVLNKNNSAITNLQKQIDALIPMIDNLILPIGSIIVGNKYLPNYGTWSLVKRISENEKLNKNGIEDLNIYIRKS